MLPLLLLLSLAIAIGVLAFTLWGVGWGSTAGERAEVLPGDAFFTERSRSHAAMTRAFSVSAPPETVWPWLAQTGRGAGWYSFDLLDNGARPSARHVVSWIPEPRLGDASPIGYLRELQEGRSLTWWLPGLRFCGAGARLTVDMHVFPQGSGSRVVIRNSADATGLLAPLALGLFRFIDSVMAVRQVIVLGRLIERHGTRRSDPKRPETGKRAQYQLYETIYASGEWAGVRGREHAERWRRAAVEAGLIEVEPGGQESS